MSNFYYRIPTQLSKEQINLMVQELESSPEFPFEEGFVGGHDNQKTLSSVRKSKIKGVYNDSWLAGVMSNMVICANREFNFDLSHWGERLQYTVYDEKGSHYGWHTDLSLPRVDEKGRETIRKLSITLLLSDPSEYEGGEFQLHNGVISEIINLRQGDAIIFPSTIPHRVRPLKSGIRRSLVGWYHGPHWR